MILLAKKIENKKPQPQSLYPKRPAIMRHLNKADFARTLQPGLQFEKLYWQKIDSQQSIKTKRLHSRRLCIFFQTKIPPLHAGFSNYEFSYNSVTNF